MITLADLKELYRFYAKGGACNCDEDELHCAAAGHLNGPQGSMIQRLAIEILEREDVCLR